MTDTQPLVGVAMGSDSDLDVMQPAIDVLADFGVPHEVRVMSAHRRPHEMLDYGSTAAERGLRVLVAGAGGAAYLPGMLASVTSVPVVGVPVPLRQLDGLDSLLSIAQMPRGVPVATVAIGNGTNAGLLAVRMLALADDELRTKLDEHREEIAEQSADADRRVRSRGDADTGFGFKPRG
jgi:5-(carboxyamino)imidazole ribonucleotide mutase